MYVLFFCFIKLPRKPVCTFGSSLKHYVLAVCVPVLHANRTEQRPSWKANTSSSSQ